ncbi:MAG: tetratricopeptide repeat protein [Marinoscillum sp.]
MKKIHLTLLTSLILNFTYAQVDVRKYATDDLFAVKPVIDSDNLDKDQNVSKSSQWEVEIQKGIDFWSSGNYDEAQYLFEQLADEYPETPIFPYYLGMINYEREAYEESIEYFKNSLKLDPLFLDAKYMLGIVLLDAGEPKAAKTLFKELVNVPDYNAYGEHGLALYYLEAGSVYKAKNYFLKTVKSDPSFLQAYIPLVSIYMYLGNTTSARKVIEQALTADNKWEQGIIIRAMISLLQDENFDQFEKDINYLIDLAPDNYHYYSIKGYLQAELGEYTEAVKLFRDAYNLEGDSLRIGEHKFNSKFKRNEGMHRSLNYYFDNYALDADARLLLDKGICQAIDGSKKDALDLFDQAIEIENHPAIHLFKGSTQRTMFLSEKAVIATFTEALQLDTTNWIAYSYRGEEYMKQGEVNAAYLDYSKVIELKPKTKEGYKNRGNILAEVEEHAQAYKDYSYGLAIDTTDLDLYFNRALMAIKMGYHKNAVIDLDIIISNKPSDGDAYYWKYQCKLAMGDSVNSISLLDSASKHSNYNDDYHKELLQEAIKLNAPDLAINAHNRLVKYNSYDYKYLLERGKFHLKDENNEQAIKDLEKYIKRRKNSGEGHYYLSQAYAKNGDVKASEKHLKRCNKLGFSPNN